MLLLYAMAILDLFAEVEMVIKVSGLFFASSPRPSCRCRRSKRHSPAFRLYGMVEAHARQAGTKIPWPRGRHACFPQFLCIQNPLRHYEEFLVRESHKKVNPLVHGWAVVKKK